METTPCAVPAKATASGAITPSVAMGKGLVADVAVVDPMQPLYLDSTLQGLSAVDLYSFNVKEALKKVALSSAHLW